MTTREMRSIAALFSSQDGLATITQLSERGVTPGLLRQRLASEEWGRIGRGVIAVGSAPPSWRRSVRAAVLAAGPHSFVSHATAARLHGFDGYERANRIIISSVEGHHVRSIEGVEVHRSTVLDNEHRRLVAGISCAIEPVALIQIAATDGRDSAAQALDSYLRDGRSAEWLRFVASPLVRPNFGGPRIVLELLRERVEARLPRSWFQRLAGRALAARGLDMVDEYPVRDVDGTLLAELDLALPSLRIGVECQSWRWHASPRAKADDNQRKRRLRGLGWEILELWWTDLDLMDDVAADLDIAIARRLSSPV